jgi:hypothetical protein
MTADLTWTAQDDESAYPGEQEVLYLEAVPEPSQVSLSLIVPAYNEQRTLARVVTLLLAVDLPCDFEVIVVDDGSDDLTPQVLGYLSHPYLRCFRHKVNQGKGAAVMTGLTQARGSHVLIFDADLEYSPDDIAAMIEPVLSGKASIVFGRRPLRAAGGHSGIRFLLGNIVTTGLARVLYRSRISDMHTCFKLVPLELLQRMPLREAGFGLDTQITVGALRSGHGVHEVPITYKPRSREQGKKIGWKDGVRCIVLLLKYRVVRAVLPAHDTELAAGERHHNVIDITSQAAVA